MTFGASVDGCELAAVELLVVKEARGQQLHAVMEFRQDPARFESSMAFGLLTNLSLFGPTRNGKVRTTYPNPRSASHFTPELGKCLLNRVTSAKSRYKSSFDF